MLPPPPTHVPHPPSATIRLRRGLSVDVFAGGATPLNADAPAGGVPLPATLARALSGAAKEKEAKGSEGAAPGLPVSLR